MSNIIHQLNLCVLIFGLFIATPALAITTVTEDITTNTTWTADSGPYYIPNNIVVSNEATLTISPGTIIKLDREVVIRVYGNFATHGTTDNPVIITSYYDDTVGGDSNQDESATTPDDQHNGSYYNRWQSIEFFPGSTGRLSGTKIKYAGYTTANVPALFNKGGDLELDNIHLDSNQYLGVGQLSGTLSIADSIFEKVSFAVVVKGGDVVLTSNTFRGTIENIISYGLAVETEGEIAFHDNVFEQVHIPISLWLTKSFIDLQFSDINAPDSLFGNSILLRGPVTSDVQLPAFDDTPYIVIGSGGSPSGIGEFLFDEYSGLTIEENTHLNFASGAIIKLDETAGIDVFGSLNFEGVEQAPVIITSIYDNEYGDDTWTQNDDDPSSKPWGDILITPEGSLTSLWTKFYYGGESQFNTGAVLTNEGGSLEVSNTAIEAGNRTAIHHKAGTTVVSFSDLISEYAYGVLNESNSAVSAVNNYWGDSGGPWPISVPDKTDLPL